MQVGDDPRHAGASVLPRPSNNFTANRNLCQDVVPVGESFHNVFIVYDTESHFEVKCFIVFKFIGIK